MNSHIFKPIAILVAFSGMFTVQSSIAADLVISVAGNQSGNVLGSPGNTVLTFNYGADAAVSFLSYNVNLTAFAPSWLSEIGVFLSDSTQTAGVLLDPGQGDNSSTTKSYSAAFDLASLGESFHVGSDGVLRVEFYEEHYDAVTPINGLWNSGSIVVGVPELSTYVYMAIGLACIGAATLGRRSSGV